MLPSVPLRGMVTAPHHLAAQAGRDVLQDGGTAVEAAVAVAACLAVVYPHMTGIGGDGFWLIAEPDGRVHAIDACGGAAAAADLPLYAGLDDGPVARPARRQHGRRHDLRLGGGAGDGAAARCRSTACCATRSTMPRPASRSPRGGAEIAAAKGAELRAQPGAWADTFEPEGRPLAEGDMLRQPALAETLRRLARDGLDGFYRGALAADIAADLGRARQPGRRRRSRRAPRRTARPLQRPIAGRDALQHCRRRPRASPRC